MIKNAVQAIKAKGIILVDGSGTRFYTTTMLTYKKLPEIVDKPMIHIPISVLISACLCGTLNLSNPAGKTTYKRPLDSGKAKYLKPFQVSKFDKSCRGIAREGNPKIPRNYILLQLCQYLFGVIYDNQYKGLEHAKHSANQFL